MEMISFDEALGIVLNSAIETGSEKVPLSESEGRVLASDVFSDTDMPPFNRSSVDGYACHSSDISGELEITEVVAAGKPPQKIPGRGQCSKVMTGAVVPGDCDLVVMVEDSIVLPSGRVKLSPRGLKPNIAIRAEDVRYGDKVLGKGKIIRPQDIAVMAAVGHTEPSVARKPVVGIISTGDELVEPWIKPGLSQIRNSNSWQLLAQMKNAGAAGKYYGIAPDSEEKTFEMVRGSISENDIVILTGGVSMGDFDFVPSILERAGIKILFDKVRVQPGKPTTFGIHRGGVVFGLPGNPVSSFIQFETLVKPLIYRMMNCEFHPPVHKYKLAERYERRSKGRMVWVPVRINENYEAVPVDFHGSAHITALPYSDGFFAMGEELQFIEKGETVSVRQI